MPPQTLVKRVESLEARMTVLETLPARVDALESQIVQLRDEMRNEFSAVCSEIRHGDEETRRSLREEIRAGDEETRRALREEIRDLGSQMRILHEDMIQRFKTLEDGRSSRPT